MLHLFYDNTLKVKQEAQNIVLDSTIGNEIQLYNIGAKVSGHGFKFGQIVSVYKDNGYYYYIVEYKLTPKARKTYKTLRQRDINLI